MFNVYAIYRDTYYTHYLESKAKLSEKKFQTLSQDEN